MTYFNRNEAEQAGNDKMIHNGVHLICLWRSTITVGHNYTVNCSFCLSLGRLLIYNLLLLVGGVVVTVIYSVANQ